MRVELLTHTPEHLISDNAKVCYKNTSDKDITHSLVYNHKHLAVLRFAFAIISVENVSVACQNQMVRSKHLDFLVESKRYVSADKGEFSFIYPDTVTDTSSKAIFRMQWDNSIEMYKLLIEKGVKKEDARAVLPINTSTNLRAAGNLQAWMDFCKLRLNSHAQKEIRDVASAVYDLLAEVYPQVFTAENKEILKGEE